MSPPDPALAAAAEIASALLGTPIDAVEKVRSAGRNSRIHRVRRGDESFALKSYPSRSLDTRDRLRIELGALQLIADHGIRSVPRVVAADKKRGYTLLEWIDGDPVGEVSAGDIDEAVEFLAAVHALRRAPAARWQPLAAEACLSAAEIVAQIERRLARLSSVAAGEPELAALLRPVRPLFAEICAWAEEEYCRRGFAFERPLPEDARTLCPSDFGFHNALRHRGRLAFVDFDYFGWDDPVKLTADFLLHPGMRLSEEHKRRFAAAMSEVYGADPDFSERLRLLYPLFGLRWCMILLNEFLPERWAHRLHAGAAAADWAAAKARQLDRAGQTVHSLSANFRRFPYG